MKRTAITLITAAVLVTLAGVLYSQQRTIRIAVAPFTPLTADAEREKLCENAALMLEKGMEDVKWFDLRKSGEIKDFLDKLTMAQLGLGNADALKGIARGLKLEYITVGSVALLDGRSEVDVRTVNVNDWTIVHSTGCRSLNVEGACNSIHNNIEKTFTCDSLEAFEKGCADKSPLSVFTFEDSNISAQKAGFGSIFAEMLSSEMGALPELMVIERTQAKALLNEKSLEMAGVIENDNSDNYFNLRGIAYKLAGSFKVFADVICISYQVVNTAKGTPVYAGYTEITSTEAIRPAARYVAKTVADALGNRIGSLTLETTPKEADIMIDGQPAGKSPLTISIAKGVHSVKASLRGYETVTQNITIEPRKLNKATLKLEPVSTKLLAEALMLEQNNKCEAALAKYQEFIDRYGDAEEVNQAWYRKGHILQNCLGRSEDAIAAFQALIGRYPDAMTRAEAYFGVAKTYKAMGNNAKAKETLTLLIEKYPDSFAAEEGRALLSQL